MGTKEPSSLHPKAMNGAREFARLFRTGQYGRLFINSGSHARGSTFHIWVLPEGVTVEGQFPGKEAVEVYGVVGGNPGWTECYGWLHNGKWQDDFRRLVEQRRAELEQQTNQSEIQKALAEQAEQDRIKSILSNY